jgi:hypothetical protein
MTYNPQKTTYNPQKAFFMPDSFTGGQNGKGQIFNS